MTWEQMQVGRQVCKSDAPEKVHFDIMPFGLFLMIRQKYPASATVRDIAHAHMQFRCVMVDNRIVFLSRFGMQPWMKAYFHLAEAQRKVIPHPAGGNGLPLHVVLVNSQTGKVLARRVAALEPELSQKLVSLLSLQDSEDKLLNKDIAVRRIESSYTTMQLAALACSNRKLKSI